MAQKLYHEWLVNFRFPNHENVKMVESELGLIPEGWQVKRLGDIAQEVRRGVNPNLVDPETPYFGLEHLPRKSIALSDWGKASDIQSTKLAFKKGEILFGKIRPYFHKVGVAPVDGICSSDAIVIQPKNSKYFAVVLSCVSSEDFVNHATQTSQGTKMPRANWDVLTKYPVILPTSNLLNQFNEFINNAVQEIQNLVLKNINLRKTRDLLLPKLISGEIEVENLDIETLEIAA
jgi:type I restriction enzyme S subunit